MTTGREVILTILKSGEFFGEMSLVDDMPRSANVIASEDSTVLILKRDQFAEYVKKSPTMALNIHGGALQALAARGRDHR